MQNLIEELYYGNLCPIERTMVKGGRCTHLMELIQRHEDTLKKSFTEEQENTWSKYNDCVSEMGSINEVFAFRQGFQIGFRLCVEATADIEEILAPKME